jgi:YD repeat-containing protein
MNSFQRLVVFVAVLGYALSGLATSMPPPCPVHPTMTITLQTDGTYKIEVDYNGPAICASSKYKLKILDPNGVCVMGNCNDLEGPAVSTVVLLFPACSPPGLYTATYSAHCYVQENATSCEDISPRPYVQDNFTIPPTPTLNVTSHITGDKLEVNYDYAGSANRAMSFTIDNGSPQAVTDPECLHPSGTCTVTLGILCGGGVMHDVALSVTGCTTKTTNQSFRVECTDAECGLRNPCRVCAGKPVNVASGDVSATVPLFSIAEPGRPLDFVLTYHSVRRMYESLIDRPLGLGWSHTFNMSMRPVNANRLQFLTSDGSTYFFDKTSTLTWQASRPATLTDIVVLSVDNKYILQTLTSEQTVFDVTTGHWLSSTDRWGNAVTAGYDMSGKLVTITDAVGRQIALSYAGSYLSQVTLWDGSSWQVGVTGGELATVSDPPHGGSAWETFSYVADQNNVSRLLSAVTDDGGALLEGHAYDTNDRGLSSVVEGGRDSITIQYDTPSPGQSVVTETRGSVSQITTYGLDFIGGVFVPRSIVGVCSTCGSTNDSEAYGYDGFGHVVSQSDGLGHTMLFTYDTYGNISTKTEAAGTPRERVTAYQYTYSSDVTFLTETAVPSVIPGAWKTIDRSYNTGTPFEQVLTTSVTGRLLPASPPTTATYTSTVTFDSRHRVTQQQGPRTDLAAVTTAIYYSDSDSVLNRRGRLQSITDPVGLTTTFDNYDVFGTSRTVTDPNGVVTTRVTDGRGRIISETNHAVSGDSNESTDYTRTFTYDTRDRLTQTTNPSGFTTQYGYEAGTNRLIDTIRVDGSGNQVERHHLTLDTSGHVTTDEDDSCTTPAASCSSWSMQRTVSSVYDAKGRLSETDQPLPAGAKILYAYDLDGKLASVQDENHASPNTIYTYDELERLTGVTQALSTATGGSIVTGYAYDVQDNLTSVTDPNGNQTTYAFDDFGRMQSQLSPVTGTTSYTYEEAGNLITATDANQAITTRTYDALNRVLTATSSCSGQSTETVTWTYDVTGTDGDYSKGRIASMTDPAGSTHYRYERRGMVRSEARTSSTGTYTTTYGYDPDGNRSKIGYPSGLTVNYTFDYADRPLSAASGATTFDSGRRARCNSLVASSARATTRDTGFRNRISVTRPRLGMSSIQDIGHGTRTGTMGSATSRASRIYSTATGRMATAMAATSCTTTSTVSRAPAPVRHFGGRWRTVMTPWGTCCNRRSAGQSRARTADRR